jgi:hypothetical protein
LDTALIIGERGGESESEDEDATGWESE